MNKDELPTVRELVGLRETKGEVGIEIEMEGRGMVFFERDKTWVCKQDGSLRGQAIEYVLRRPIERKEIPDALTKLVKKTEEVGSVFEPSDRCGVHIHLNVQPFTFPEVMNMALLYLVFEEVLVKYCGEDREGNFFCLRASDAEFLVNSLIEARRNSDIHMLCNNDLRYASMNMSALGNYGSIEFRSLRTPKDILEIEKWAQMLLKIKDASQNFQEPYEIVEGFSRNGLSYFINAIFGDLEPLLRFPNREEMIMSGLRTVQDVAYTPVKRPLIKRYELYPPPQPRRAREDDPFFHEDPEVEAQEFPIDEAAPNPEEAGDQVHRERIEQLYRNLNIPIAHAPDDWGGVNE